MEPLGKRLAAGDAGAFAEIYEQCAVRLHHYLVACLRSRDAADEVLQEVFVRLVTQRATLDRVENLPAYLFAIARNEAMRFVERRGRHTHGHLPLSAEKLYLEAKADDPARRD